MRILFAGDFRVNSGSSHVVQQYSAAAARRGWEVRISSQFGSLDSEIGKWLRVCDDGRWADRLILVFESKQFLTPPQVEQIQKIWKRHQVLIIDPDGRFGATVRSEGDSNHREYSGESWSLLYRSLSDVILQPKLLACSPGTFFFAYHGIEICSRPHVEKLFDIQYIGNNWYRWSAVSRFLGGIDLAFLKSRRVAFRGKWWDGSSCRGHEAATTADPALFAERGVLTTGSVPFGAVVEEMSKSVISPIFVRPMLAAQGIVTPRMFESFAAQTIPLLMPENRYLLKLYGNDAEMLQNNHGAVERMLADPHQYTELVSVIREDLLTRYNYDCLLEELKGFF